jgi:tetratricopeptide (TPR) repeat protein
MQGQAAAQLRGMGGNGKSLLAREYAIRFGPAFPGGVFWLNAYGNDDTRGTLDTGAREALRSDQIRGFCHKLGIAAEGRKPAEVEAAFWQCVAQRTQSVLWIVDDLPSGLSLSEIEQRWVAGWTGASTLITTRCREYGGCGSVLDLDVLSPEEAVELLGRHRHAGNAAEAAAMRRIAEELGNHPLAVEVAGGFLAVGVQTFEQYLQELAAPGLLAVEFGAELRESLPTGHDRSISRTLLKSIRQLSPGGLDFLRVASVLAVAPIPLALVGQILPEVVSAIDAVDSLSLCEKSGSDARTVHTLVSRTVRFVLADDGRLGEVRNAVIRRLSERLQLVPDIRRHSDVASEIFHARHILGAGLLTAEQATLGAWVAEYDYARGDLPTARRLREEVVEVRSRLLGEEHPDTLNAKSSLAATLWAQGEFVAAQKLEEQVLRAMRPLLGDDHPDTLNAMHVLALIFWAQNRWAGGRELEEQVLGEDHLDTLKAMGNLAHSRWAEGDLVGARELEEQVLEAMRRLLGDEHPHTLTAMNNLADTLRTQGDLVRARKLQEQVLEAMRRLLGEEHPHTLAVINNLAATLKAEGSLARAQKLLEHVLEGRRRVLGVDHPDTLVTLRALADTISCAEQLGRFEK